MSKHVISILLGFLACCSTTVHTYNKRMVEGWRYIPYTRQIYENHRAALLEIDGKEVWIPRTWIRDQDRKARIVALTAEKAAEKNL